MLIGESVAFARCRARGSQVRDAIPDLLTDSEISKYLPDGLFKSDDTINIAKLADNGTVVKMDSLDDINVRLSVDWINGRIIFRGGYFEIDRSPGDAVQVVKGAEVRLYLQKIEQREGRIPICPLDNPSPMV